MLKPPLYLFDPDQTHDLLWAERIDGRISTLLFNAFENHGPFYEGFLPVVLVDRYIPGGDSIPWASEWTTTYFEFLKPLSRTHLLTDGEINGSAYGFTPEYQANLPSSLNLKAAWPEFTKIKVSKGQTGLISWLERAHIETYTGRYCPQVSNQIQVWMRRHKVIAAFEDLEIELDCRLWLHNSVVLQNATLEGISQAQRRLLNYADLDDVLEDCYGQFNISNCNVLTGITYAYQSPTIINSVLGDPDLAHQRPTGTLVAGNPEFFSIPDWYYFASLYYAFPEKETESNNSDKGKPIKLVFDTNETSMTASLSIASDLEIINDPKTVRFDPGYGGSKVGLIYKQVDEDVWQPGQPENGQYYIDYVFKNTSRNDFNYIYYSRAIEDNYAIFLPAGNQVLGGDWRGVILGISPSGPVGQLMPDAPLTNHILGLLESGWGFIINEGYTFPSDFTTGAQTYLQVIDWKAHNSNIFQSRITKLVGAGARISLDNSYKYIAQTIDQIEFRYSIASEGKIRIDDTLSAIE